LAATTVRFGIVLLPESLAGFGGLCREVEESGFDWLDVADSLDHDERAHRSQGNVWIRKRWDPVAYSQQLSAHHSALRPRRQDQDCL